jgi:hypothetical protein
LVFGHRSNSMPAVATFLRCRQTSVWPDSEEKCHQI